MLRTNFRLTSSCRQPLPVFLLLLVFLFLAALSGCQPRVGDKSDLPFREDLERGENETVRLSLFLNLKDPDSPAIRMEVNSLEVLVDQAWLPVKYGPLSLDAGKIGPSQVFLGSRWVHPGRYDGVRFTLTQFSVIQSSGEYQTVSIEPYIIELRLPDPIRLGKDASQSMFLTWDVLKSLENTDNLSTSMYLSLPVKQLFVDLVYVACPEINTIFIVRGDKNWVVDSFGIKGKPTYLALAPEPSSTQRLYVLASSESRIKVVELNSQRVIESYMIPFVKKPAFMTVSPDGQMVYILDERDRYITLLDLSTGRLLARVRLEYHPRYAAYLAESHELVVSYDTSQTISFLNPQNLREIRRVDVADIPDGLLASGNLLYIAESGDNSMSIYDSNNNILLTRMEVGFRPRRLLEADNQIYVSNYDGGTISVVFPGLLGVGQEISGLGRPLEMVYAPKNGWIYVGDEQKDGLAFIESTTNQLRGYINLGARPMGLAIIQ